MSAVGFVLAGASALGLLLGLLDPRAACAQAETSAPTETAPPAGSYEAEIATALGHYREHDWQNARRAFERAHALQPNARTLRGIALAAFYAGDYVAAADSFEQALTATERPLSGEQREQSLALLERARAAIAQIRVSANPADASIKLNELHLSTDQRALLPPGRYRLEVTLTGYRPHREELTLSAGQWLNVRIDLSIEVSRAENVAQRDVRSELASQPRVDSGRTHSGSRLALAAWITAGTTLALTATGVSFAVAGNNELDRLRNTCKQEGCSAATRDALWKHSPIQSYGVLANVAFAGAAVGAITTTVLFTLSLRAERLEPQLSVSPLPFGARLDARF